MSDKLCGFAGCEKPGLHLCSGCGGRTYCGKEHQKEDWPNHKLACKTSTKPEAASLLGSFQGLSLTQLKNVLRAKAASFGENKRRVVLQRLEKVVEKDDLLKLVEEHVQPGEIESLLSGAPSTTSSSSAAKVMRNADKKTKDAVRNAVNGVDTSKAPSAEMVLRQAQEMRRNPDKVRRANEVFAKMSNAEIIAYADQMEQAARDPEKFKAMMELSKMPESDRNEMQVIQEGLTGTRPRDEAWIVSVVTILKKNPALIKSMYSSGVDKQKAGVDGEQIDTFVDFVCGLPDWVLVIAGKALNYGVEVWPTVSAAYTKVDNLMLGCAKYVLMAILFVILYYVTRMVWWALSLVFGVARGGYRLLTGSSTAASVPAAASSVAKSAAAKASSLAGQAAASVKQAAEAVGDDFEF